MMLCFLFVTMRFAAYARVYLFDENDVIDIIDLFWTWLKLATNIITQ